MSCDCQVPGGAVYAVGDVSVHWPDEGTRREAASLAGPLHAVLQDWAHLARRAAWRLDVQGMAAWWLVPVDDASRGDLVQSLAPEPHARPEVWVAIGHRGPPRTTAGLSLPTLHLEHVLGFPEADLRGHYEGAEPLWQASRQVVANLGVEPSHRALNYAWARLVDLHQQLGSLGREGHTLVAVQAVPSRLAAGGREVWRLVFRLRSPTGQDLALSLRVDATDLYPFALEPRLQPYLER